MEANNPEDIHVVEPRYSERRIEPLNFTEVSNPESMSQLERDGGSTRLGSRQRLVISGTKLRVDKYFPCESYKNLKLLLIQMKEKKLYVQKCIICLESIQSEQQCRMLSCYHIFHKDCIDGWLINAS